MRFERISLQEAADKLRHMEGVRKWDTSGGLASIEEVIGQGAAFLAYRDNQPVMLFAIQKFDRAHGKVLEVRVARELVAAGGLTEACLPAIEYAFGYDCQAVRIVTRRRGLIEKLKAQQYQDMATIMQKAL